MYGKNSNFKPNSVLKGLLENDEFGFFSNSFLVEFGLKDSKLSNVIFAKSSLIRNEEYMVTTIQEDNRCYYKTSKNTNHLNGMLDIQLKMDENNIPNVKIKKENNRYKIEECLRR